MGKTDRLERARRLKHVLPPRTGGTLAALESAITAHVDVEGDRPEMITWLYDQWEEVDDWIEQESSVVLEEG